MRRLLAKPVEIDEVVGVEANVGWPDGEDLDLVKEVSSMGSPTADQWR